MNKPCTTWLVFCLLGMLSIPIMGCGGGSLAANKAPVTGSPSITWNPPASIQYGAALSDVELNATASVPGNFVYSPTAGTVLQAGAQKLTVTFTPSDTVTYSTVTTNVQLMVTQATPGITWAPLSAYSGRHGPRRSTVECDGECTRYALVQSGSGHRSAGRHTTAHSHVHTVRHDQLQADNSTRLAHHYSGGPERSNHRMEYAGVDSIRHRLEQRPIGRYSERPG